MTPPVLVAGVIAQGLAFLYARLRNGQPARLPGAVGFYLGTVTAALALLGFDSAQWIN